MPENNDSDGLSPDTADGFQFALNVEGPGIRPTSFDVPRTLEFIQAFLGLVESVAGEAGIRIDGMRIGEGSVQFAFDSPDANRLQRLAIMSSRLIAGDSEPVRGQKSQLKRARDALKRLPSEHMISVEDKATRFRMPIARHGYIPEQHVERISIRGQVIGIDGDKPSIKLKTLIGRLSLRTDASTIEKIDGLIYRHVDADVELTYVDSKPKDGKLISYTVVPRMSPDEQIEKWKHWFANVGSDWKDISDIEAELEKGRGRDNQ